MMISMKQIRWMGVCAVLGGATWMGLSIVLTVFDDMGRVYGSDGTGFIYGGVAGALILFSMALVLLCGMLGTVGLYAQQGAQIRKVGSIGFRILLAGISSLFIADALMFLMLVGVFSSKEYFGFPGGVGLWWFIFFAAGTYLLTPVGLLLFGIGLPSPSRRVAFVLLGWLAVVQVIWWNGLTLGAALGIVNIVLPGLCLVLLGYSIWSRSGPVSRLETNV